MQKIEKKLRNFAKNCKKMRKIEKNGEEIAKFGEILRKNEKKREEIRISNIEIRNKFENQIFKCSK